MRELIKTIKLFNDGSYEEVICDKNSSKSEQIETILENIFQDRSSGKRIQMNVAIYCLLKEVYDSDDSCINDAIYDIANHQGITRNSVVDKMYRQLNLTSVDYRNKINEALKGDTAGLKEQLSKNVGSYTNQGDENLINKYIV